MNNRILLSSPCYGNVAPEILEDWMRFAYHCGRRMPEYDFFLAIKTKSEQFRARNAIVECAQQYNCDWILMLDDDMVINPEGIGGNEPGDSASVYDFLKKMMTHDKDICGALYFQRGQECEPVLMKKLNEKGYRFLRDEEIEAGLQEVDVAGGGCLLIKTRIFDRIPFPYFSPEHQYGTDIQLAQQAQKKGFSIWADTSIELGHLRNERITVTSRNRHQFQDAVARDRSGIKRTFVASELYESLIQDVMAYTGKTTRDEVLHQTDAFLALRKESTLSDADWYREFPIERICRQVWYNTEVSEKKMATQFILSLIPPNVPRRILDFGCGIGIDAFALAEKGHLVTACDIRGTGTFEFLKWRVAKYNVPMIFIDSDGGKPQIRGGFDAIIAMDCLEHMKNWKEVLSILSGHLNPGGILFANNGSMYDLTQPEHYDLPPKEFVKACAEADLLPQTQLSYIKMEIPHVTAETSNTDSVQK